MNCYLCPNRPEVFCPCSKCFICSSHLVQHLSERCGHSFELIDNLLSKLQQKAFKEKLINRLKSIDEAIHSITIQMKDLIYKIMSSGKSAIKELETHAQWFQNLISINKFSPSLLKEVDNIMSTELNIEVVKQDFSSKINFKDIFKPKVTEVLASNQIIENCMGCSNLGIVFNASCKHLLCVECIKLSCKMCELLKFDTISNKPSVVPNNLNKTNEKEQEKCFICKKPNKTHQKRDCGHLTCNNCTHTRCCNKRKPILTITNYGKCEICYKTNVAIQSKYCKHSRCNSCEQSKCRLCNQSIEESYLLYNTNQNEIAKILNKEKSTIYGTCGRCGLLCKGSFCESCL